MWICARSPQKQIDLMNQAILKNTLAAATPRFFIRSDGAVNENEYADWTRPFVHTNGNLGADSIAPIHTAGLDSVYVAIHAEQDRRDEGDGGQPGCGQRRNGLRRDGGHGHRRACRRQAASSRAT